MKKKKLSIDIDALGEGITSAMNDERAAIADAPDRFEEGDAVEDVDPAREDLD